MDGCTRQDPAYRPAKERAPFAGSFLCLLAGVAEVHRVRMARPTQGEVPAPGGQVDDRRPRPAHDAARERAADGLAGLDSLSADPEVTAAQLQRFARDP